MSHDDHFHHRCDRQSGRRALDIVYWEWLRFGLDPKSRRGRPRRNSKAE